MTQHPSVIGGRYRVQDVLGRGGAAVVYRVSDTVSGRDVALKRLVLSDDARLAKETSGLFEREFHTLAQLSHPSVIEVYDYGVDDAVPYYTMELLEGSDLREQSPMPWREACGLLFDVCSSLALIHSRRLVHRDITPRNIRTTRHGHAKLIDFGAMMPMGVSTLIVGTPPFLAPEVLFHSMLDGRTDLFSLGATLFYSLTGRSPYPARTLTELPELWTSTLAPPSSLVEDVPQVLDHLVMSLLSFEPAMRPASAFEVMQRLQGIAGIERVEPVSVSRAYLSTPILVGRDEPLATIRREVERALGGHGRGLLIQGESGLGRSRLLDACVVTAKLRGAAVLRAGANSGGSENFTVARILAAQLLESLPDTARSSAQTEGATDLLFSKGANGSQELNDISAPSLDRFELQTALTRWFLRVAETHPLAIAVDDVHRVDEASLTLLAALASQANRLQLLVTVTLALGTPATAPRAVEVLCGPSTKLTLLPLTAKESLSLFTSVFGDVPNVGLVSDAIHQVSGGNPRVSMDLAQHLADKGLIFYQGGVWTLPPRLDESDLPSSTGEALRMRLSALSPLSRSLVEAQALAAHEAFSREDYIVVSGADPKEVDRATSELVAEQVLASDGRIYTLAHRGWVPALISDLGEAEARDRHSALAGLYAMKPGLARIRHLFEAGLEERGLDELMKIVQTKPPEQAFEDPYLSAKQVAVTVDRALDQALSLGRSGREVNELRRWLSALGTASEDKYYWRAGPDWLDQLKHDSGLAIWQGLGEIDPGLRLARTFQGAAEQYAATPEAQRVYAPDEAVRHLARHVAVSVAVGGRSIDMKLLQSLPALLEPFVALSPVLDAMRLNAIATCEVTCFGRLLRARSGWIEVHQRLSSPACRDVEYADVVRNALAYAIGMLEARMGMTSALSWAEMLDSDPLHRVSAVHLRRCVRLQQGDWEEAERLRRHADVLGLQSRSRQMFNQLWLELAVYASAGDLTGLKQVIDRIEPLATRYAGWKAYRHVGEGHFQRLRGDPEAAREAFERGVSLSLPDADDPLRSRLAWPAATAGLIGTLVELERYDEAVALGSSALERCKEFEFDVLSHEISRALAIAEAKRGDYMAAGVRLEALIEEQRELGVAGLYLGASYEARAHVAIWARDLEALDKYASLTADEYRHARGSPLGARYERLMDEARRVEARKLPRLSQFASTHAEITGISVNTSPATVVTEAMRGAEGTPDRAARALALLCNSNGAHDGHLYLFVESGLSLVASYLPKPEPDGLPEFVNSYVQRELGESRTLTVQAAIPIVDTLGDNWTDNHGVIHWPLLLTAVVHGVAQCAGVAVLSGGDPGHLFAAVSPLARALGSHFIELGDARGVESWEDNTGATVVAEG
jgi:hypothetical protein